MNRAMLVSCFLFLVAACNAKSTPGLVLPGPSPVPTVPAYSNEITPGESVEGVFVGPAQYFFLVVPTDGTLTATLSWDPDHTDSLLKLVIDETEFNPQSDEPSPLVATVPVEAGARYQLAVALLGTGSAPNDPFELTTALN